MSTAPFLPADPLGRFLSLAQAVAAHKRWNQGWSMLRYATLGLLGVPGDPAALVERLFRVADELAERARWSSALRNDLRFCVAASLVRRDADGSRFGELFERTREHFRSAKLARSEVHEALAILVLGDESQGRVPDRARVARLAEVHAAMKRHHGFLTGTDDYPAAALLSATDEQPSAVAARLERLYEGLRDLKFKRGNQLQLASQLLFFAPGDDARLLQRFRSLWTAFGEHGLWMHSGDYDEVAVLASLDHEAEVIVSRVLSDRERLRAELRPRVGKEEGFTLASSTAFFGLASVDGERRAITDGMALARVIALIQAQQTAMVIAATSAATAAAATASNS